MMYIGVVALRCEDVSSGLQALIEQISGKPVQSRAAATGSGPGPQSVPRNQRTGGNVTTQVCAPA